MKTIVVGLGNPILGDDGVGWCVAEEVRKFIDPVMPVQVECFSLGGISLMEQLVGYQQAILIDACFSDAEPGSVIVSKLDELPDISAFHTTSVHDVSLQNAMKLGRGLGVQLPDIVNVVGISARQVHDFGEELSPPVADAVSTAAQHVIKLVMQTS